MRASNGHDELPAESEESFGRYDDAADHDKADDEDEPDQADEDSDSSGPGSDGD